MIKQKIVLWLDNQQKLWLIMMKQQLKFLLLFLSAVHRPPFRPPKKNSPDFAPLSDLRRPTWGQSYTVRPILYNVYTLGQIYKHVQSVKIE